MDVSVDQARKYPPPLQVKLFDTQRRVEGRGIIADPNDARASDQQVFDPARLGRVEVGVVKDPHSGDKKIVDAGFRVDGPVVDGRWSIEFLARRPRPTEVVVELVETSTEQDSTLE